ncbi:MAG: 5-formyltetrahydrofolate cyclo-ligase [Corynebacterium sp.]|nr:5-formyltetrahydrofolate cyclo-ligase [Corynebacterium sp.]
MDDVSATRTRLRAARTRLAADPQRPRWDRQIAMRLVDHARQLHAHTLTAYYPLAHEPGGRALLSTATAAGLTVWLPHSLPGGRLSWSRYAGEDHLREGAFHIPVPTTPSVKNLEETGAELIVAPALAVTPTGVRFGQGGGYYDRLLASYHTLPSAVIVWSREIHEQLPVCAHDARCDTILTDGGEDVPAGG